MPKTSKDELIKGHDNQYVLDVIGAAFSHDLRSPTNTSWSYIRSLQENFEEQKNLIQMNDEAARLNRELNDLREYSKTLLKLLSTSLTEIRMAQNIPQEVIRNITDDIRINYESYNCRIRKLLKDVMHLRSQNDFEFLKNSDNKRIWVGLDRISRRSTSMISGLQTVVDFNNNADVDTECNISNSFDDVLSAISQSLTDQSVHVKFGHFFLTDETTSIESKTVFLKILFNNLLENALRYAVPNDNVDLYFGVRQADFGDLKSKYHTRLKKYLADGPWIEINIGNRHGANSLPKEITSTMFDLFRTENRKYDDQHGGAGVGLAVCRLLCFLMHGVIFYDDTHDGITNFVILLPQKRKSGIQKSDLLKFERLSKTKIY